MSLAWRQTYNEGIFSTVALHIAKPAVPRCLTFAGFCNPLISENLGHMTKVKVKGKVNVDRLVVNTPLRRSGMARVLKGSHSFTCTPRVHPLTEIRNEPYLNYRYDLDNNYINNISTTTTSSSSSSSSTFKSAGSHNAASAIKCDNS